MHRNMRHKIHPSMQQLVDDIWGHHPTLSSEETITNKIVTIPTIDDYTITQLHDSRRPGCTLELIFQPMLLLNPDCARAAQWLKDESGLKTNITEKILAIKISKHILIILFDESVNGFEAMQQVDSEAVYGFVELTGVNVKMNCQLELRMLRVVPDLNSKMMCMEKLQEQLELYGPVLAMHRIKRANICIGEIRVLMLLESFVKCPIPKRNENIKISIDTEYYKPNEFGRLDEEKVKNLWEKFSFSSKEKAHSYLLDQKSKKMPRVLWKNTYILVAIIILLLLLPSMAHMISMNFFDYDLFGAMEEFNNRSFP